MADDRGSRFLGIIAPPRRIALALALALAFCSQLALAAGPFDGQWKGGAPGQAKSLSEKCLHPLDITVAVADGAVSGTAHGGYGDHPISGKVGPDGAFTGTLSGGEFTGTFSGDSFTGGFHTGFPGCAIRSVNLQRGK
jgi:hypothetical protein